MPDSFQLHVIRTCDPDGEINYGHRDVDWQAKDDCLHHVMERAEFDVEQKVFNKRYTSPVPGMDCLDIKGAGCHKRSGLLVVGDDPLAAFLMIGQWIDCWHWSEENRLMNVIILI